MVQELVWDKQWSTGEASQERYKEAPSSKLTAVLYSWGDALGTVVTVYQDDSKILQYANETEKIWQSTTLSCTAKRGTALSLMRLPVYNEKKSNSVVL